MKTLIRTALVVGLAILASACKQGGQLTLDSQAPSSSLTLQEASGADFVSSSAQYQTSLINGYQVQQSVGDFVPQIQQTSTGGYTMYNTVQGVLISQ